MGPIGLIEDQKQKPDLTSEGVIGIDFLTRSRSLGTSKKRFGELQSAIAETDFIALFKSSRALQFVTVNRGAIFRCHIMQFASQIAVD